MKSCLIIYHLFADTVRSSGCSLYLLQGVQQKKESAYSCIATNSAVRSAVLNLTLKRLLFNYDISAAGVLQHQEVETWILGWDSSVGIATRYSLDSPGIESWWGARFSAPVKTGPGSHPASCLMGTGSFPGIKCGRGVLLTTHPLLVSRSWKSRAIPLPTLWPTPGL